jgi:hypothetical protein
MCTSASARHFEKMENQKAKGKRQKAKMESGHWAGGHSSLILRRLPFVFLLLPFAFCLLPFDFSLRAEVTDRFLAVVNDRVITESEAVWALALDPELQPLDLSAQNKRAMLERLIDVVLLDQEAEKIPQNEPSKEEIDNYKNELVKRFGSKSVFDERMQRVGLNEESLNQIVSRWLKIFKYIDFRFRAFVFVRPEEIERYYREVALPRLRNRGGQVRTLEEMRDDIEHILIEEKFNAELDRFFDEARQQAQIVRLPQL